MTIHKSKTDLHWNKRATNIGQDIDVNTMDIFQRNLELYYISQYLKPHMHILEVGCGNGYSTSVFSSLAQHVDAFDYSEDMIKRAKSKYKEQNNRFFHDNVLSPQHIHKVYDTIICVRVLVNLQNLEEQRLAIKNLLPLIRPKGLLILVEGFKEGFVALDKLRGEVGLSPLKPAKINFYSSLNDILPKLEGQFILESKFHLGMYDYLTRIFYPLITGANNVKHNTVFSERSCQLAQRFNPDNFEQFSRVRGFVFRKKEAKCQQT